MHFQSLPRKLLTLETVTARLVCSALAVLGLTTVHHVYGAFHYHTPFRLHVAVIAFWVAAAIVVSHRLFARSRSVAWFSLLSATTLLFPVALIGAFEGIYNHLAKNALYFAGASSTLLFRLFPPPTYELPNDLFFEVTGVLQIVPAAFAASFYVHVYRAWRSVRAETSRPREANRLPVADSAGAEPCNTRE